MLFEDKEYYGEIWFPEKGNEKEFCLLKKVNNTITLTTKLSGNNPYSSDLIFGIFTGLGCLTFINNKIINYSSGMIISISYSPEYCIIGNHFIENPKDFKTLNTTIVNSDLRKWLWWYLFDLIDPNSSVKLPQEIKEEVFLDNETKLSIETWTLQKSSRTNYNLELQSKALLSFEFKENKSILEVIDLYHKFQKFLILFHGSAKQFETFKLTCKNCDKSFELYFRDEFHKENYYSLLNLNYDILKDDINVILKEWFNNEDILICVDKILQNSLSSKLSFSQKFINSYIALESYLKRFSKSNGKDFKVYLEKNKDIIISITEIEDDKFENYIRSLIRTRDYYVYDNVKQKNYFKGIDLLYEAIMLESLVSILILKELKVSEKVIQKAIKKVNSDYVHSKSTNLFLNRDILKNPL